MDPLALDQAQQGLGFALWQSTNRWQKAMSDALKPLDLTYVQVMLLAGVLQLSQQGEAVTQNRLSQHVHADVMMTSKVCRTLERKGLLLRANNRLDNRAKTLVVTKVGSALLSDALGFVQSVDEAFFQGLPDAEQLLTALNALQEKTVGEHIV